MPTVNEIIEELKSLGSESTKKVLLKHGAKEPFYGVKVEDLKKIQKRIKNEQDLALALYDTGISDAMYLAGLVADGSKMTKAQLQNWAEKASWHMISEYTVPWVTSESAFGETLALEWIGSKNPSVASAGWAALSAIVSVKKDEELDLPQLKKLLKQVESTIHDAPNRVRSTMNGFMIAVGSYVTALTNDAIETGKRVGTVFVDVGGTACKVPSALDYIDKVVQKGTAGKKRKTAKC